MKNIVLIGMPAVGKSTVGVILAKLFGFDFIDTDLIIQRKEDRLLKEIIEEKGAEGFIKLENRILSGLDVEGAVIATGGSVVYGREAMEKLSRDSTVIYLRLGCDKLRNRLKSLKNRGVVIRDGQSLNDLYTERAPMYEKYADIVIDTDQCSIERTVGKIMAELGRSL